MLQSHLWSTLSPIEVIAYKHNPLSTELLQPVACDSVYRKTLFSHYMLLANIDWVPVMYPETCWHWRQDNQCDMVSYLQELIGGLKWTSKDLSTLRQRISYLGFLKCFKRGEENWLWGWKPCILQIKRVSIPLFNMTCKWKKNWTCHLSLPLYDIDIGVPSTIHHQSNTLTFLEPIMTHTCVSQFHSEEEDSCLGLPNVCQIRFLLSLPHGKGILCLHTFM